MDFERQISVMAAQFRACFKADEWLWARILLFIIFGIWGVAGIFVSVVLFGFVQSMFVSIGDELDLFVKNEKRSPLVRTAMLVMACPITYLRYVIAPMFSMIIYIFNFLYNAFAYIVSLGSSGWHGTLQYKEQTSTQTPSEEN